jgi:hypothetical protein
MLWWVPLLAAAAVALGLAGFALAHGTLVRLRRMTLAMLQLAEGETDVAIPALADRDRGAA